MSAIVLTDGANGGVPPDVARDPAFRALEAQLRQLETTFIMARTSFARNAGFTFDNRRDMYGVLGYRDLVMTSDYRAKYQRGGIAKRIVDTMPDATWRGFMELIEDEEQEEYTPFEQAWHDFDQRLQVQAKLRRVDKLAGLSTYSVLLIGAADVASPEDLIQPLAKGKDPAGVLYLQPFLGGGGVHSGSFRADRAVATDTDVSIWEYDIDPKSSRFGQPLTYRLRRVELGNALPAPVHYTRVLHVAEGLLDDEVFGIPSLECVWNLIEDLEKVTGGGAEAFWLRANQGLHLDVDKDMSLDPTSAAATLDKLKDDLESYKHGLTRWMRTRGVSVNTLGSDVANFGPSADAILTQIAGAKGIPKRVLTGSEMGELASSQDRENFRDVIVGRQTQYAGPYIVRPLVDRLIAYGYLPTPAKGPDAYDVQWPHIQVMTEDEKAAGAQRWAQVNATFGMTVFSDAETRDHWYDKAPLELEQEQQDQESWRAALAEKMAMTNKTEGAVVFTDDEIRKVCYGWRPLTPEEKIPITAPERVSTNAPTPEGELAPGQAGVAPPAVKAPGAPAKANPFMKAAGDIAGHEFHGNQYVSDAAAAAHDEAAKAHEIAALGNASSSSAEKLTKEAAKASDKVVSGTAYVKRPDGLREANSSSPAGMAVRAAYQARESEKRSETARGPQAAKSALESRVKYHQEAAGHHRRQAELHRTGTITSASAHVEAQIAALAAAIEANDLAEVARLVGLGDVPGHEFHGNQWTAGGASVGDKVTYKAGTHTDRLSGGVINHITDTHVFVTTTGGQTQKMSHDYFAKVHVSTEKARGLEAVPVGVGIVPVHKNANGTALCGQPTTEAQLAEDDADVTCVKCLGLLA